MNKFSIRLFFRGIVWGIADCRDNFKIWKWIITKDLNEDLGEWLKGGWSAYE